MRVSVMITTSNRLVDLRRTLQILRKLDPAPDQILITADGCTDGTVDFVHSAAPQVTLIVNQPASGSVASRDCMIREARGDLLVVLDDDSYPEQLDCIGRIVPTFEQQILAPVATRCWEIGLAVDRKSQYEGRRSWK
jgi:glycosyltransferase involved in cell wall biosynthesis